MQSTNLIVSMSLIEDNYNYFLQQCEYFANQFHLDVHDVESHAIDFICKYNYIENKSSTKSYISRMVSYATKDLYKELYPKVVIDNEPVFRFTAISETHSYTEEEFDIKESYLSLIEALKHLVSTDYVAFSNLRNALKNRKPINAGIDPALSKEIYNYLTTCRLGVNGLLNLLITVEKENSVLAV